MNVAHEPLSEELHEFYAGEIAPYIPPHLLDFHAHSWSADNWKELPWESADPAGRYMVVQEQYSPEELISDGRTCFPDRHYDAVCFGIPTPAVDWEKDTAYIAHAARKYSELHPLLLAGPALKLDKNQYIEAVDAGGFLGFKVFLNWYGNNYGGIGVEDMVGPEERAAANERELILLLHVPRAGRLADPEIQAGVRWLSKQCPQAKIVLAHCGRCYTPAEMKAAIGCLRGLENVWMDTSMVMDPIVLQIAIEEKGPSGLVFGTDFPVAAMRGRRVRVMDHWVDVVLDQYPPSAFRAASDNIRAGFMAWEIVLAIRWAAEMAGIAGTERNRIFYGNGMKLLHGS